LKETSPTNTDNNSNSSKPSSISSTTNNNNSSNSSSSGNANNLIINRDMMTMSDNNQKIDTISSFLSNGYDQLISILTSENKLCERKLIIFNNKRIEEENKKISYMRKVAKSKQLEEAQSLDPANFRNQKNF
jgi:hypothetical protein